MGLSTLVDHAEWAALKESVQALGEELERLTNENTVYRKKYVTRTAYEAIRVARDDLIESLRYTRDILKDETTRQQVAIDLLTVELSLVQSRIPHLEGEIKEALEMGDTIKSDCLAAAEAEQARLKEMCEDHGKIPFWDPTATLTRKGELLFSVSTAYATASRIVEAIKAIK